MEFKYQFENIIRSYFDDHLQGNEKNASGTNPSLLMIASNKITQVVEISRAQQPFQNQEEVGLFTFYKLQQANEPLRTPKGPLPSLANPFLNSHKQAPQKRSKTEGTRSAINKKASQHKRRQEDCLEHELKFIKTKASEVLKCRLQLISDNSFEARSIRKNTTKHHNATPSKLKTEMYCTQQRGDFREGEQIVQLIRIKQVTSEQVKQLFRPKRQAINRFLSSSLSNSQIQYESQQGQAKKIRLPCMEVQETLAAAQQEETPETLPSAKTTTKVEISTKRREQISFLDYIYRQKTIISEQYSKLKHKKRLQQIITTVQARQKIFNRREHFNSPTAQPISDRSRLKDPDPLHQ